MWRVRLSMQRPLQINATSAKLMRCSVLPAVCRDARAAKLLCVCPACMPLVSAHKQRGRWLRPGSEVNRGHPRRNCRGIETNPPLSWHSFLFSNSLQEILVFLKKHLRIMNKTRPEESPKSEYVWPFFWGRGPMYRAGGTNICTARDQFCCICRHHTPGGPCTSPWRPLQPPVRKTGIVAATFLGFPCPFFGQRQGLLRAKVAVVAFVAFPSALRRCSGAVGHM